MFSVAVVVDGIVVNMIIFGNDEDFDNFDFTQSYGDSAIGIRLPEVYDVQMGYKYENGEFIAPPPPEPTHDELVSQAELHKSELIRSANAVFLEWQTRLLLDIATPEQKQAVTDWVNYVDQVRAVNTQQAPDIAWPEKPEVPAVE